LIATPAAWEQRGAHKRRAQRAVLCCLAVLLTSSLSCSEPTQSADIQDFELCSNQAPPISTCSDDFSCILDNLSDSSSGCWTCLASGALTCALSHCPDLAKSSCLEGCLASDGAKLCSLENCDNLSLFDCVFDAVKEEQCNNLFAPCGIEFVTIQTKVCVHCRDKNRTCEPDGDLGSCGPCAPGFVEQSGFCVAMSVCPEGACAPHGRCVVTDGVARCSCDPGFAPTQGLLCQSAMTTNSWIEVVPAGSTASFWQGTVPYDSLERSNSVIHNAQPCHPVTLTRAYAMTQYEVSVQEYWLCVRAGACDPPAPCWLGAQHDPLDAARANHPVVCAGAGHAEQYCSWVGGRLPSESEWEYAANPNEGCAPHINYPWGSATIGADIANYMNEANPFTGTAQDVAVNGGPTTPVGFFDGSLRTRETSGWTGGPETFQTRDNSSPFGIYDLAGNVGEWTLDCWHDNYALKPHSDGSPWVEAPTDCARRVKRGDSWGDDAGAMMTYFRGSKKSFVNDSFMGIRCVRDLTTSIEP